MTHDRFIELLTRELTEQLSDNEGEELAAAVAAHPEYRRERELLVAYWQREKGEYATSQALFNRVLEKIQGKESTEGEFEVELGLPGVSEVAVGDGAREGEVEEVVVVTGADGEVIGSDDEVTGSDDERGSGRRKWRVAGRWAAAAAVLGVVSVVIFLGRGPQERVVAANEAVHWLKRTTLPTQKDMVTLADGTVVRLNSATTLVYPEKFTDSTRRVYLEGEAFFDVSKDAAHPFLIHADKMNIRVLGTSFDLKSYNNESIGEATLINGSIEVTLTDRPADRIILKPREKLTVQHNLITKRPADAGVSTPDSSGKNTRYSLANLTYYPNPARTIVETSWLENKLVFSGKDFVDLSGQLERWYGVHIEFRNDRVKHYNFTGIIEKETLREALDALKMIEPFQYSIADS